MGQIRRYDAQCDRGYIGPSRLSSDDQGRSGPAIRPRPRLIDLREPNDQAPSGGSEGSGGAAGATFLRFAGARLAAVLFFAGDFLAADFFALAFFVAPFLVAFLATTLRPPFLAAAFLAGRFFVAAFLVGFFTAALAICNVPLNRLHLRAFQGASQERLQGYLRFACTQDSNSSCQAPLQRDYRIIARCLTVRCLNQSFAGSWRPRTIAAIDLAPVRPNSLLTRADAYRRAFDFQASAMIATAGVR